MQNTIKSQNIIENLEREYLAQKTIPAFRAGDTVAVKVRIREGERERLQTYEGIVIAKKNRGINSSFIVRKYSHGKGVERTFQTYSPLVAEIEVKRRGDVRLAKLYYLRKLFGKNARIKEKIISKLADASASLEGVANFVADATTEAAIEASAPVAAEAEAVPVADSAASQPEAKAPKATARPAKSRAAKAATKA